MEVPVQDIFCYMLRVRSGFGASLALEFHGRLYPEDPHNAEYMVITDMNAILPHKDIPHAPVSELWNFAVD